MSDISEKLRTLKTDAISVLEEVLGGAESEDVRRKAAVDILNFSEIPIFILILIDVGFE